jgi:hypothetical protein
VVGFENSGDLLILQTILQKDPLNGNGQTENYYVCMQNLVIGIQLIPAFHRGGIFSLQKKFVCSMFILGQENNFTPFNDYSVRNIRTHWNVLFQASFELANSVELQIVGNKSALKKIFVICAF